MGFLVNYATFLQSGIDFRQYCCRGVVLGEIYGNIIYPANQTLDYAPAILENVVFSKPFAQSWFIGPNGTRYWSTESFYNAERVQIYNPGKSLLQFCVW